MLVRTDIIDGAQDHLRQSVMPKVIREDLYYGRDCDCDWFRMMQIWIGIHAVKCPDVLDSDVEQNVLGGLQILSR